MFHSMNFNFSDFEYVQDQLTLNSLRDNMQCLRLPTFTPVPAEALWGVPQ